MDATEKVCEICHDSESRWRLGRIYVQRETGAVASLQKVSKRHGRHWVPTALAESPLMLLPTAQFEVDLCDECHTALEDLQRVLVLWPPIQPQPAR